MKNQIEVTAISLPPSKIEIPDGYKREENAIKYDALRQSIKASGIQQRLAIGKRADGSYRLIKGGRRLSLAMELRHKEVPCVYVSIPKGVNEDAFCDKLRFILDEHRQDLLPSQRAELIAGLKTKFNMNNAQVGAYMGVAPDSIRNWLRLEEYIPELVREIDAGNVTMNAARAFAGLTADGQQTILETHKADLKTMEGGAFHKMIRKTYSPIDFPDLYKNSADVSAKMKRGKGTRNIKKRPKNLSSDDKARLARDLSLRDVELEDSRTELEQIKKEIARATIPIHAIKNDPELWALVPESMKPEFERFTEVY